MDGAGNLLREYAYYPGIDQPHSVRRASDGAIFRYTQEVPGHVSGLVAAGNTVVNTYTYAPFGEPLATSEQVKQPLRYASREYDEETGLYYVRARYYDPQQGRFVSEDPIGLAGGINPYVYAAGDPVNLTDPTGEAPCLPGYSLRRVQVEAEDGTTRIELICKNKDGQSHVPLPEILVGGTGPERTVNWDTFTGPYAGGMTGGSGTYSDPGSSLGLTPGGGWGGTGSLPNRFAYSPEQRACQKSAFKNTVNTALMFGGAGAAIRVVQGAGKLATALRTARAASAEITVGGLWSAWSTHDDWAEYQKQCGSVSPHAPVVY